MDLDIAEVYMDVDVEVKMELRVEMEVQIEVKVDIDGEVKEEKNGCSKTTNTYEQIQY